MVRCFRDAVCGRSNLCRVPYVATGARPRQPSGAKLILGCDSDKAMKFTIHNKQKAASIDESFWKRAFNYAATELQIEHLCAEVHCFFIEMKTEREVKFKGGLSLGATGLVEGGAWFYVVSTPGMECPHFPDRDLAIRASSSSNRSQMVKTFFHEMTHVKQLLIGELILKPRYWRWKGEKWDRREYSFAPWEVEAQTFSDK
jgi:hypothetical protein